MEIKYAILGSDMNPLYLDFWSIISKVWVKKFNIIPVLGLICDEDSDFIESEYGLIKKFKSIPGISNAMQSQIIRLYLPKFFPNDVCVISDIDMLPMSKKYFIDDLNQYNDNQIIIHSSDNPECNRSNEIPMCYNSAKGQLFTDIFEIDKKSWEQFANELNNMGCGWFTDQRFLWEKINQHKHIKDVVFLNRGWVGQAVNRIDRINWQYDPEMVKNDIYIDSHLLRPYNENKTQVDELINLVLWNL